MMKCGKLEQRGVGGAGGPGRGAEAGDQPAAVGPVVLDDERPAALEHERAARLEAQDLQARRGVQQHGVAGLALLPLGVDAIGVAHAAAGEVLEPRVAVEAAAVLADLRDPRPHGLVRAPRSARHASAGRRRPA